MGPFRSEHSGSISAPSPRDTLWLVADAREIETFTFSAFRASKLTKAIYALYSHAQLPGAGLIDREGWPDGEYEQLNGASLKRVWRSDSIGTRRLMGGVCQSLVTSSAVARAGVPLLPVS